MLFTCFHWHHHKDLNCHLPQQWWIGVPHIQHRGSFLGKLQQNPIILGLATRNYASQCHLRKIQKEDVHSEHEMYLCGHQHSKKILWDLLKIPDEKAQYILKSSWSLFFYKLDHSKNMVIALSCHINSTVLILKSSKFENLKN